MSIYQSTVFDLELKFSEGWMVRSWKNWKKPPEKIERFQTFDTDLPDSQQKIKTLFTAIEMVKEGPNLISKDIYIDAIWTDEILDIGSAIPKSENEISRTITNELILEKEYQSIIRIYKNNENNMYQQLFMIPVSQNIWLCVSVMGDTKTNFQNAKTELFKISKLK